MREPILLILGLLFINLAITKAQHSTIPETREIVLNYSDTIQKIRIFVINPALKPLKSKVYAWYQKQTVLHTEGAWAGKLLHDKSETFYPNNNLLEQGNYERGWKVGLWKKWYSDGRLMETTTWKSGALHGVKEVYNASGELVEKGKYVRGKQHGFYSTWVDGKEVREKYRKGKLVVKKEKKVKAVKEPKVVKDSVITEEPTSAKEAKKSKRTPKANAEAAPKPNTEADKVVAPKTKVKKQKKGK